MNQKIQRIGIANRGEVAVRIIRACQELGIETVLLHSEVDQNSPAARMADYLVCIGSNSLNDSYLNVEANIAGALSQGVDAIHPGFGFLSENARFAEACFENGIQFIGPSADSIRLFGDKISAKKLVEKAGGPTIPGYQGEDQTLETLVFEAKKIGFPCIVKASAGGGGRGLKVIRKESESKEMIESAQREGLAAFGSSRVFLERYLENSKHIEIQIFGDASGRIHVLGERECSIQRRHQKMIEEAPAVLLHPQIRKKMYEAAKNIAEQAQYKNAGTIEFLVENNEFYFMEMNTRLQVEHPVTELTSQIDLVKAQILTAMGRATPWDEILCRGHAIECRIYAENPHMGSIPSTGQIGYCHWPQGPGRRFEVGVESGDLVTSFYDSMIAKVIVWDETRPRALKKMEAVLRETIIFGVHTNIPLLIEILKRPEVISGEMNTRFFEEQFPSALPVLVFTQTEEDLIAKTRARVEDSRLSFEAETINPWLNFWRP